MGDLVQYSAPVDGTQPRRARIEFNAHCLPKDCLGQYLRTLLALPFNLLFILFSSVVPPVFISLFSPLFIHFLKRTLARGIFDASFQGYPTHVLTKRINCVASLFAYDKFIFNKHDYRQPSFTAHR